MSTTPSPMPSLGQRDTLQHLWISGADFGAGDVPICKTCGIRQSDPRSNGLCAEITKAMRLPRPVRHDYDPFAS